MTTIDPFRPRCELARTIYEAFQREATMRPSRPGLSWMLAEQEAVLRAAQDVAQIFGLPEPDCKDVERAEQLASGHSDYGAKWSVYVVEAMYRNLAHGQPQEFR